MEYGVAEDFAVGLGEGIVWVYATAATGPAGALPDPYSTFLIVLPLSILPRLVSFSHLAIDFSCSSRTVR